MGNSKVSHTKDPLVSKHDNIRAVQFVLFFVFLHIHGMVVDGENATHVNCR